MAKTQLIATTFVELADTLVASYDVIDFLHLLTERCVELLGVSEAGVMLADPTGGLRVLASSSERMEALELLELQTEDGPCLDAWHSKGAVAEPDLVGHGAARWPRFAPLAVDAGFSSVYALPMRLRQQCIGALNLFGDDVSGLGDDDALLGQALADVASIGILHERFTREQQLVSDQLHTALSSRIVIEQAKGVIAQRAGVDVNAAFVLIRNHARSSQRPLSEVANDIVQRRIPAGLLATL